jgi:hypothetical protein
VAARRHRLRDQPLHAPSGDQMFRSAGIVANGISARGNICDLGL